MKVFSAIIVFALFVSWFIFATDHERTQKAHTLSMPQGKKNAVMETDPICLGPETITGKKTSSDKYSWQYGYDICVKNHKIIVTAAINLIPTRQIKLPLIDQVKQSWEKEIEHTWGNRFAVSLPSGEQFPIVVDAVFRGPRFHHDVIVRPGPDTSNQLNWNITDSPAVAAHEFGHMLGVYDEYEKGALSPATKITDTTSIMTSNPKTGLTYDRHYLDILKWFKSRTHISEAFLSRIKEKNASMISNNKEGRV